MTYSDKEVIMKPEKKQARLEALKVKHRELDTTIKKEYNLHLDVAHMKSEKLRMKQEIFALERELGDNG
jgi:uncharacterized protein YdcH (DUF465 family)